MLLELPAGSEGMDNIVAFWSPDLPPAQGDRLDADYRIRILSDRSADSGIGRVLATRIAPVPGRAAPARRFVIDFEVNPDSGEPPRAEVSANPGVADNVVVERNPHAGGWRVTFDVVGTGLGDVGLTCVLTRDGVPLTEIWQLPWDPDSP